MSVSITNYITNEIYLDSNMNFHLIISVITLHLSKNFIIII